MNATVIAALISLFSQLANAYVSFVTWLHEQDLVQSGIATQQLEDLKRQIHDAQLAIAAREAVRADIAAHPDRLPIDDPFLRD